MKKSLFRILAAVSIVALAHAQNNQPNQPNQPGNPDTNNNEETGDQQGRNGFWEASMPGGNFVVALSRITSVSRHNYVLDGAVIVDEVTIDTEGQALVRFYFIKPIQAPGGTGAAVTAAAERLTDLADGAARRAGVNTQDMVVKKYPLTTHAKTVEYRLLAEEQLNALYRSAKTAWMNGRGRQFTVR